MARDIPALAEYAKPFTTEGTEDTEKRKTLPLMNADDTDQSRVLPRIDAEERRSESLDALRFPAIRIQGCAEAQSGQTSAKMGSLGWDREG